MITLQNDMNTLLLLQYRFVFHHSYAKRLIYIGFHDPQEILCLLSTPSRVTRSIYRALNMSGDTIFTRIELASNNTVLGEGSANSLANLTDRTVWVNYRYVVST